MNDVAARDTTFDNVKPESVWIIHRTTKDAKYIVCFVCVNGIEKEIAKFYVGEYDGLICESTNLTWTLKSALESANAEYAAVAEKLLNMAIEHKKLADENTKLAWYKEQWQSIAGKANLKHLVDENETLKNQVAVLSYRSPSNLMLENAKLREANTQLRAALEEINKEELNAQRPGGGYSRSAKISFEALKSVKK